jgi:fructosamine-3-kinase
MIPESIRDHFNKWLSENNGDANGITSAKLLSGGCINDCLVVYASSGSYFIKYNLTDKFPAMFDAEEKGLELLRNADCIQIPEVIYQGISGIYSFLVLEYIEAGQQKANFWDNLGKNLARLHSVSNSSFGLDHDNYIGSLPQKNKTHASWDEFMAVQRFHPLVKQSFDLGLLGREDIRGFDRLIGKLRNLIPEEDPSLLHGDLWSGNYITASNGEACLIDPAVYFGHREMDIAMTKLFGGFSPAFYRSYNEEYPLEKGWEKRLEMNQLYPLLVHLILFGASYAGQIRYILKSF